LSLAYFPENAEALFGARRLSNPLVREYLTDPALFLEALQAAQMLLAIAARIAWHARSIGLPAKLTKS
jgi:hypothetical protein